jgi:hypothetical protein
MGKTIIALYNTKAWKITHNGTEILSGIKWHNHIPKNWSVMVAIKILFWIQVVKICLIHQMKKNAFVYVVIVYGMVFPFYKSSNSRKQKP